MLLLLFVVVLGLTPPLGAAGVAIGAVPGLLEDAATLLEGVIAFPLGAGLGVAAPAGLGVKGAALVGVGMELFMPG